MIIPKKNFTSKLGTDINIGGITGKPLQRIKRLANTGYGDRAAMVAKRNRMKIRRAGAPGTTPVTDTPATTTPDYQIPAGEMNPTGPINFQPIADGGPTTPGAPSQDQINTLFPSTRMFEPQNYEGSPLYQFQLKEGQKQVAKSLAARGLTGSGYGITQELNVPLRAAAQDTERMTQIASQNADRLKSFQDNEALRQERAGNNQWDRAYSVAELMARQSPYQSAIDGLNNSADSMLGAGSAQANFLKDYFKKVIAQGGGGGGGRGGSSGTPIPVPGAPNYINTQPTGISGNYSSNNGWLDLLTKGLSSFFPSAPTK